MTAILGITDGDDGGAALVVDGRVVAAVNEERLNRLKMSIGFPRLAIAEVLRIAGLSPQDVDHVAMAAFSDAFNPQSKANQGWFRDDRRRVGWNRLSSELARPLGQNRAARRVHRSIKRLSLGPRRLGVPVLLSELGISAPVRYYDHHDCHGLAAYDASGFERALTVTLDGGGDGISACIYQCSDDKVEAIHHVDSFHSIGNYYAYVTHLCGYKATIHEGKITGLAAHGTPRHLQCFERLIQHRDGSIVNTGRVYYHSALRALRHALPADWIHADLAASVQLHLEHVVTSFVKHWLTVTGERALCVAGGVFANVRLNQCLAELPEVERLYVFPAMGDGGLAAGAAISGYRSVHGQRCQAWPHVFLGPAYPVEALEEAIVASRLPYHRCENVAREIAEMLNNKQVVARFDGAMEYGPRALGNRSILVHGGDVTVNDWLNHKLHRTEFMPFAPACTMEQARSSFSWNDACSAALRYMTVTMNCQDSLRSTCPAVVHLDGTARPQIVDRDTNPGFHAILEAYGEISHKPALINTSFNMHEEPIVCTPQDALRAFEASSLDALAIGPFIVRPHK